jgi:hypothetical protein
VATTLEAKESRGSIMIRQEVLERTDSSIFLT